LQADIVADLIRNGIEVHAFNHRTIAGILDMIRMVGAMVGAEAKADALAHSYEVRLDEARARAAALPRRPKVFFEEWDEPLISAIGWVSELVEVAGGDDIFPDRAKQAGAQGRIVTTDDVLAKQPDIIIGSWCGKKFQPAKVRARPGFADVPAVANNRLHEIKSSIILQPGPAALTDGLTAMQAIIEGGVRS
jgi:iron complex transport system substrate-binding protein